ncbi:MAG: hydroxyacid dehydrogenase, partial [Bacteroidales bacterium]|nr:hydroxyacid dehydrogenase [Bacteroidales bacterium]
MKIVFLDAATMGSTPLTEIEKLGELERYDNSTAEEARERVRDADVAIVNKVVVDKEFLDAAPKLRLVCEAVTGMNNLDAGLCDERGVV